VVVAISILLLALTFSCSKEPYWNFRWQVLNQQGNPLSDAEVEIHPIYNPHQLMSQLGIPRKVTDYIVHTDVNGYFKVNYSASFLFLKIKKDGYISKDYQFSLSNVGPECLTATRKVILNKTQPIPEQDELDKQGDRELWADFDNKNQLCVDLLGSSITEVPDSNTVAFISLQNNIGELKVSCQGGATGKKIDFEDGITIDSWKASNALMSANDMTEEFTIQSRFRLSSGYPTAAFLLKGTGYYARIYIVCAGPKVFYLRYDMSRDTAFVPVNKH